MLHLLKKAGFQGDSCLVGICPAQLAATADGFDFRLHGGQVEILVVDDPWRGGDDLRRGQCLLPDQAFDDSVGGGLFSEISLPVPVPIPACSGLVSGNGPGPSPLRESLRLADLQRHGRCGPSGSWRAS